MKKIFFVLVAILFLAGTQQVKSQVSVSVNIGTPPAWGVYGYDDARYYFMPDIDVYYDVWYGNYWYIDRGVWVSATFLPRRFGYYNFYNGYKVVLDYRGGTPYRYYHDHCNRYYAYRNYHGPRQVTYRDRGGYKGKSYAPERANGGRQDQGYRQKRQISENRDGRHFQGGNDRGSAPRMQNRDGRHFQGNDRGSAPSMQRQQGGRHFQGGNNGPAPSMQRQQGGRHFQGNDRGSAPRQRQSGGQRGGGHNR